MEPGTFIGLDFGASRIGMAIADTNSRLPRPLPAINNDDQILKVLQKIIDDNKVKQIIIGRPRSLEGLSTHQTEVVQQFVEQLRKSIDIQVKMQDEAVTSKKAEAELIARGKPFTKGDIDSLAAVYILEDYLRDLAVINHD